jgi:hypothetical protein
MHLNLLDYTFSLMDSDERPLAFAIVFHLKIQMPKEMLELGANKAMKLYPKVACCINGTKWKTIPGKFQIVEFQVESEEEKKELIDKLLSRKIKINEERLLKQYLIHQGGRSSLMTHCHHSLADGASLAFWLQAQLGNYHSPAQGQVEFKSPKKQEKLSKYVFDTVSDYIQPQIKNKISANKRTLSFCFDTPKHLNTDFTYNDKIVASILKGIRRWDKSILKASLWMPVNIRKNSYVGFGNGSSRVRIYDHTKENESIEILAKNIRTQVRWNKENGTWAVPASLFLVKILNLWPFKVLLKKYLSRESVDYGTTIFSHMEMLQDDQELYQMLDNIEVMNLLHQKIPITMFAIGFAGKTNFTLTYDGELFSQESIGELKQILSDSIIP